MSGIELVDFGFEPVVTDSRFNEAPLAAVYHLLTASRDNVSHSDTSNAEEKENEKGNT